MFTVNRNKIIKHITLMMCITDMLLACIYMTGCNNPGSVIASEDFRYEYGVFIGTDKKLDKLDDYRIVVIDAQYYDADEIASFKENGHTVYSYINIGSLENFRDYYDEYKNLAFGTYEHWEDEVWIDVSDTGWQSFVTEELAGSLADKGIDGFFVDNCDVYYNYPTDEILNGIAAIMKELKGFGLDVVINGGDTFMDAYCSEIGNWDDVITGINQETVFSSILWDKDSFGKASEEDNAYFRDYLDRYASMGADIYLLEYTKDRSLVRTIEDYCDENGYLYYISGSLELK